MGELTYLKADFCFDANIINRMSKFKVKFTYGQPQDDNFKQVESVHQGPLNLSNIYDALNNPTYQQIQYQEAKPLRTQQVSEVRGSGTRPINPQDYKMTKQTRPSEKEIESIPTVEVISKPSSPKKVQKMDSYQEAAISSSRGGMGKKTDSIRPSLQFEQIRESEFKKKKEVKYEKKQQSEDIPGQIVLKAPRFKINPDDDKDGKVKAIKKEYVRAEKTEKYLYSGIPQKSENDFVGCFGCFNQKNKAYTISNNE